MPESFASERAGRKGAFPLSEEDRTFPDPSEYDPHYETYVSKAKERNVLSALATELLSTTTLLEKVSPSRFDFRYAPGKWTLREVVGHVVDTERIFGFRAFCFARGEKAPLPGVDEDSYARHAASDRYSLPDLLREFADLRRSHVSFLAHLEPAAWERVGVANGRPISVRALAHVLLGHERHHIDVIRKKYLEETP